MVVANQEYKDMIMEDNDKRSLCESAPPSRDDILRTGPKHARAYKSPFTTSVRVSCHIPIEAASQLPAVQSSRFNLSDNDIQGSNSQAASALASTSSPPSVADLKVVDSMTCIEIMMCCLLKEQDDRNED